MPQLPNPRSGPTGSTLAERNGELAVVASVVIPTRNRESLVQRAIRSVLAQTFEGFELIVVDDGSTDATQSAVTAFDDPRARYLHQPPSGAAAARNRGARAARGGILTFLDSDDTVEPLWLEKTLPFFADPDVALVFCGARQVDTQGRPIDELPPHYMGPMLNGWTGLFNDGTFLVRRQVFEAVGGYTENLPANQHTELGIRLVDLCDAQGRTGVSVNEPLVRFQAHEGPRIRNDRRAVLEATEYMLDHYRERLQRYPGDYSDYLAVAGTLATRLGEGRRARRHLVEAIRFDPRRPKNYLRLLRTFLPL